jgi:hypothetical protein
MKTMNAARRAVSALPFFAALLGGCAADAGGEIEDLAGGQGEGEVSAPRAHVMPLRSSLEQEARPARSLPASARLTYYGGPVLAHVKVVTIFWGAEVRYASRLNAFYAGVTDSAYFDWLSEYDTPTQKIGRGTFGGSYADATAPTGSITDAMIQGELKKLIAGGQVPAPDADTYYAVHFAPGVGVTSSDGSSSCVQFCAYHGTYATGSAKNPYVYYGVVPDQGGACAGGCGGDPSAFNNLTSVSSHELVEATTDAAVGVATVTAAPLGWYDLTYGEIGDICNAEQGSIVGGDGETYVVQAEFSNARSACLVESVASGACGHDACAAGKRLSSTCDPCAAKLCASDAYCCGTAWDDLCVRKVKSICGRTCR